MKWLIFFTAVGKWCETVVSFLLRLAGITAERKNK